MSADDPRWTTAHSRYHVCGSFEGPDGGERFAEAVRLGRAYLKDYPRIEV